ncbi:MAG: ATP-grasp domain-containing protein, partial [Cyanobacteria bacterium]|nr:ATP-grasp domain-containing protein [Cyanobacteriota bacterium]
LPIFGQYWAEAKYEDSSLEAEEAIKVASEAAARVDVPFLVVDVGQTQQGNWIVIECNDGQESGYAGVSRMAVWQKIIEIERTK